MVFQSSNVDIELSVIGRLATVIGAEEDAFRFLVSLLLGYPLAVCYRHFFYGQSPSSQHLFFTVCGLFLWYFNFGFDVIHSVANIAIIYLILVFFGRTSTSVILAFIVNMTYLCTGYYMTMTYTYIITWTTPHCVLTLRLIGLVFDVYDGKFEPDKLSAERKETALSRIPSLLEICGHTYFFGGCLVGPQFSMKRYQDFISGSYTSHIYGNKPNSTRPALMRLLAGLVYTLVFQLGYLFVPDSLLSTESFTERSLFSKCLIIAIWGKLTLYKYVACWLFAEGVSIWTGLTYGGKNESGTEIWDSCANMKMRNYERASTCHELILAFNINTNRWMAKYIFKRLQFLGNKELSRAITLFFLALWHGFYTGYYMNFGFEFFIVNFENQAGPILYSLALVRKLYTVPGGAAVIWIVKKFYAQFALGYGLVSYSLYSFENYGAVYSSVYWIGHVLFIIVWPLTYWFLSKGSRVSRPSSTDVSKPNKLE